ncbi:rhamnogalacturonan lyase [Aquibacillus salsiterrae]|uniref:Rhamnogalacturonan lyase n=1 Tax=Aquibacillus salsiterrae TaxID=2950439 RepID=A0A9X3WFV8_9BACI|nr:rhamnogalacturonan lyase [Aquibacillus salsiterrae]MDC3417570.1 rhamnogalacturonan lyase [Aquibacillus salsiterrae]
MKKRSRNKRSLILFTIFLLIFSNFSFVVQAEVTDKSQYNLLLETDFENGDAWGFSPGGGTTVEVVSDDSGNQYLQTAGAGSGNRLVTKSFDQPTSDSQVLFTFDWKPGDVSTALNSSEISFSDINNNPIFRLIKAGGTSGQIMYEVGDSGADLTGATAIPNVSTDGSWLSVEVLFDFVTEQISIEIFDKANEANMFTASSIDFSTLSYVNSIASIGSNGNRASGNNLSFTTGLDNFSIYGSGVQAPVQDPENIQNITTDYMSEFSIPVGVAKEDVISFLPSVMDATLENGVEIDGIPVNWDSEDYTDTATGSYAFTGILDLADFPNAKNDNNVVATATVKVEEQPPIPQVEGYEPVYFSDFGDAVEAVPPNWGFTTNAATVSINRDDIAGNDTPKLDFSIVNQSGGRNATKNFDTSVKGEQILVKFDWYPGKNNDKGDRPEENGGEFRIIDSSGNTVFTLNNTNNAPLTFFAGNKTPTETSITNPEAWYSVEVNFDLYNNEVSLSLVNQETSQSEAYTSSLDRVAFDGSIATVRLSGIRTSGNNHTWTTYLDNLGVYSVPINDNTITKVADLPYQRVYVGETAAEIDSIGLPETVTATLASGRTVKVNISEWVAVGKEWNPNQSGVYSFKGTLADVEGINNDFNRTATLYVYNRLTPPETARNTEWLDRGVVALNAEDGIFISWRLLADEYDKDVRFNIYRGEEKLNKDPLSVSNYQDLEGKPGDTYTVETLVNGKRTEKNSIEAKGENYLSIPMQKPEGGTTTTGDYTYSVNDASVGDLDGDGEFEVVVKWYPSNAIDSSQTDMTGPTIFDAYKLDGTLLWRINMGRNLTSGAHYNQFVVADLDGNGKSEFLIKTADATTSYGVTNGEFDSNKVISVIGNAEDDGKWVNDSGHVTGGPEYMSVFNGETGEVIDTIDFAFPVEKEAGDGGSSWGDTWYNRSDRFLSGLAYLDGQKPSAIYGRGYYGRTTFVAYDLENGELVERWTFDSDEAGRGGGLGNHNLATGDVDNDGFDEIVAGSLTLDDDGSILYAMDGKMGREPGSHGDALRVGAFDPDREGIHVFGVREETSAASVEYHDGATGETLMSYYANKDAGRGVAANITSNPGYEFWGTGGNTVETGGGIYNVQGNVVANSFRDAGLSVNFALYWDGDLLQELLDDTTISKYNEDNGEAELLRTFEGVVSNNGTKATPTLQADILGDWREEVLLPTTDSSELRIFSTTIPTDYRIYTLMHDAVYRNAVAAQNSAYNQPPLTGFYLGEDISDRVLSEQLKAPSVNYVNKAGVLNNLINSVTLELTDNKYAVLRNKLIQAKHQLDIGRPKQAAKFLQDFIKQLEKSGLDQEQISTYSSKAQSLLE